MIPQQHAHIARPHKEPPPHAPNAALMIDFDNVTMGIRSDLQSELRRLLQSDIIRGKVAVQRAYADWRRYPQYIVPLSESSIDLIFAPAYGSNKKNATDIRLAIDALELVFTRPEIGTFILLSGDSDFSSLVLKLKEYGKYVIGVGIRESSSDLLIQNCDEYYSYNELAGLTRESDVTQERRDPWELVVEAMKQMTAHNDVMRSDRLKQVMQEIDPSFDEKDAGFSRFSKFVVEAAHRGLLALTKLDNGQYELALGPEVTGAPAGPAPRLAEPRPERARGEGRGRRGASQAHGDSLGVLRQALGRFGAAAQGVSADDVRAAMVDIGGQPVDPDQFPELLRQAHEADVIELSQDENGASLVRLRAERPPETPSPIEASAEPEAESAAPAVVPARSARFRRGSRGARLTPPEIPKVGVVEVDPNFKPRMELVPTRPEPPASAPASPAATRGEEERGGRNDRPRRGRGRRGGSGRRGQTSRDGGEREGERPRGGRGRGRGGQAQGGVEEDRASVAPRAPVADSAPPAPKPTVAPVPSAAPAASESEGDSFWTRVRRGLTGGA
jgi:uncharacterized protein (TIGR00288 family)